MEENGNQTFMCCVLFLDIVEYSKRSVAVQISLKERFVSYLSFAILDVPQADRIILDAGDGAAVNFLGDVADALKAALSLRLSLLNDVAVSDESNPPLLMRMGINLGPVRLVRESDGQPNIVGDGINVAQRIMGFADPGQILVTRSYYDAVSKLAVQYAGMFQYQGSRTDKHIREHEIYAFSDRNDQSTTENIAGLSVNSARATGNLAPRFWQSDPTQRALYVGAVTVFLLLFITLVVKLFHHQRVIVAPDRIGMESVSANQAASVVAPVNTGTADMMEDNNKSPMPTAEKQNASQVTGVEKPIESRQHPENQHKAQEIVNNQAAVVSPDAGAHGYISVNCLEGTRLFVDGKQMGMVGSWPLNIPITPGKHTVIVRAPNAESKSQNVVIKASRTLRIEASYCN